MKKNVEKILQYVQKPARYAGGELNSVIKNKSQIDLRYAFCFRYEPPRNEDPLFTCEQQGGFLVRARFCAGYRYGRANA